jgi:hypothetical protein
MRITTRNVMDLTELMELNNKMIEGALKVYSRPSTNMSTLREEIVNKMNEIQSKLSQHNVEDLSTLVADGYKILVEILPELKAMAAIDGSVVQSPNHTTLVCLALYDRKMRGVGNAL